MIMDELAQNIAYQAGFAGMILATCFYMFTRMMKYIEGKDEAHERDRNERDERYIFECKRWREDVGSALRNNTVAMQELCKMIDTTEDKNNERFHATDKKMDKLIEKAGFSRA
jgi:crotonobetainyl-CoA:carnitine CoA-transferase CaiB-like acyl-CoA transferase